MPSNSHLNDRNNKGPLTAEVKTQYVPILLS